MKASPNFFLQAVSSLEVIFIVSHLWDRCSPRRRNSYSCDSDADESGSGDDDDDNDDDDDGSSNDSDGSNDSDAEFLAGVGCHQRL